MKEQQLAVKYPFFDRKKNSGREFVKIKCEIYYYALLQENGNEMKWNKYLHKSTKHILIFAFPVEETQPASQLEVQIEPEPN